MIGRSNALYRSRRSFRRYIWALIIVFVFCLWNSSTVTWRKSANSEADLEPSTSNPSPETVEAIIEAESPRAGRINVRHSHSNLERIWNAEAPHIVLSPHSDTQPRTIHNHNVGSSVGGGSMLTTDDDTENHDLDGIEKIEEHRNEGGIEHATKLSHPDDDGNAGFESGDIASNENAQIPIIDAKAKDDADDLAQSQDINESQAPVEKLETQTPWSEHYEFPSWDQCEELKEKAEGLPDLYHVPFEVSVKDVVLEGWEDEWISKARYSGPKLDEPRIDFVYTWVNGSQQELVETMKPYELNSSLNDADGVWIGSHGSNRYREWDELRYSMRSVEKYAGHFTNRIQILVNAFKNAKTDDSSPTTYGKQWPHWLRSGIEKVQVLSQEEFFGSEERKCLPSFDSLTIENQLYNTKSEVDRLFALSDDMILGKPHSASDIYSPLFGPTLGFKTNAYNTLQPPTEKDAERFGEKPFLIYTSWLLNRRFGARKRKGQVHFGHSLSRSIAREAITSFPRPALRSAYQRFRGETGFQLYSWYIIFHYTMERHREALLWSYIMMRSDSNNDGYLDWNERQNVMNDLAEGLSNEPPETFRRRMYYHVQDYLEQAGLKPPVVNNDILWTSLDGPIMTKDLDCDAFDTEDCLAPGFSISSSDAEARSPIFSTATIFDRVTRESPRCGDCLIKLVLNRQRAGLEPLLPHPVQKAKQRETVIKALIKFQYTVVNPDAMFYMITDAEQAEHVLLRPYLKQNKKAGQICLNDDVVTSNKHDLEQLKTVMNTFFNGILPEVSSYEV
ncbi:hypothetical protein GGP41_007328 [Bipolaris sorokiniana]|uniref:Stealth protein CR1 conserved region 1 domain-containing protein n=2 Tax=Cochliobolus sativus TaxID=45130 RepID=A0A8H6E067_COCSA|nr:uncharacterized protein COCSADRAFT_34240 [Bipolaris sorokiniana ND90Pr]EMD67430.1 hypothetical protein COCSADRAFT_34240 [Bipolaris sorokiniana ND90Pr]KAF5854507.1 hypothetical protein GGP41_007328 [Bipolaris sorokiniana]